ncbi:MAG: Rieske 2Fe-2S domain-containing protein [Alphaproteobacteria bacterium]|nr:Rieske 2Fe-2S domain-containing protein [Alphaproteobacteria bacterium]
MAWKKLCAFADIPENALKKLEIDGIPILLARIDGEVRAYPPLCPHMAEPLEISGLCDAGTLTCTKHLWQWDMKSGGELGMAEKPLLLYPVKREGEDVLIEIERELAYEYD